MRHGLPLFAAKRLLKLGHIHHYVVDAVLGNGMRIGQYLGAQQLRTLIVAPFIGGGEKELLPRLRDEPRLMVCSLWWT